MEKFITASLIGSLITLLIRALIDALSDHKRHKRELRKQVFERKTNAVEMAMSWYQEALDNFVMLQQACDSFGNNADNIALFKLQTAAMKADMMFKESATRLNTIYLYYDFMDIEKKHNVYNSMQYINYGITEIIKLNNAAPNATEIVFADIYKNALTILKEVSKAIEDQKLCIIDIQCKLRTEYKQYLG